MIGDYTEIILTGFITNDMATRRIPEHAYRLAVDNVSGSYVQQNVDPQATLDQYGYLRVLLGARNIGEPATLYGGYGKSVSYPNTVLFNWLEHVENS